MPVEKRQEAQRKYNASEKGRDRHRRYNASEKGRERNHRYDTSEKGRERNRNAVRRYKATPKGVMVNALSSVNSQTRLIEERARRVLQGSPFIELIRDEDDIQGIREGAFTQYLNEMLRPRL